jgi:cytochrome b6
MLFRSRAEKCRRWLEERIDLSSVKESISHKTVPQHKHSLWYYMGGMTLFLYFVQVVTGILLLLYYRPTAEAAYESVQFIITEVKFGWLIRSIHAWAANLMIFFVFLHMFSVFFFKSYRKPRELTWISGVLLLFLALGFGFSGYLLPWNQLAYFATKVGTEIAGAVPLIGNFLVKYLRGGEDVTGATLTRFFGFHVAVLPMVTAVFLTIHLILVQKQGMSWPIPEARNPSKKVIPFSPHFLLRELLGWLIAFGILIYLASVFPWELGEKADPLSPAPAGIKPEWFFVFMFQTLKFLPVKVLFMEGELLGIVAFTILGALLLLVPFLDKKASRELCSSFFTTVGVIAIIYILVMTALGYMVK